MFTKAYCIKESESCTKVFILKTLNSVTWCPRKIQTSSLGWNFPMVFSLFPKIQRWRDSPLCCCLAWHRCVHLSVGVEADGPAPSKKSSKVLFALLRRLQRLTKVHGNWLKSTGIHVLKPSGEIGVFIAQLAAVTVKLFTLPWNFLFPLVKNGIYWWHVLILILLIRGVYSNVTWSIFY